MSDHIYKKIELVGSSPNGIEDAVNTICAILATSARPDMARTIGATTEP